MKKKKKYNDGYSARDHAMYARGYLAAKRRYGGYPLTETPVSLTPVRMWRVPALLVVEARDEDGAKQEAVIKLQGVGGIETGKPEMLK